MSRKNEKKSFRKSLTRLEEITNLLESEEIELEEALQLYEEGINLSRFCLSSLKSAEIKITELKKKIENLPLDEGKLFEEE
ncbi:MAG: exodeoxyribonuclease VII small subunit [Ignavibacteria bacterium GWA2_35_9]|nr:MAG: exodeoxyribonuclease VII small subunit [Ignavibacteria bacterium GWA2_35_9]OGU43058.1 MAG: exodeoxyribonuclease VII small subunit [Ignavibacteria bacterium GWB2_36_8]OGU52231.1 MAG: exodeoxyribonuclease VII small subunit [Ignavibacteria bacterium GWC2_36_12]OGU97797.1 MAG: exodeoxyribonuclease VII small subunit [Ignavibacteria bacterium RIFOXYA2_FULL_37_17]